MNTKGIIQFLKFNFSQRIKQKSKNSINNIIPKDKSINKRLEINVKSRSNYEGYFEKQSERDSKMNISSNPNKLTHSKVNKALVEQNNRKNSLSKNLINANYDSNEVISKKLKEDQKKIRKITSNPNIPVSITEKEIYNSLLKQGLLPEIKLKRMIDNSANYTQEEFKEEVLSELKKNLRLYLNKSIVEIARITRNNSFFAKDFPEFWETLCDEIDQRIESSWTNQQYCDITNYISKVEFETKQEFMMLMEDSILDNPFPFHPKEHYDLLNSFLDYGIVTAPFINNACFKVLKHNEIFTLLQITKLTCRINNTNNAIDGNFGLNKYLESMIFHVNNQNNKTDYKKSNPNNILACKFSDILAITGLIIKENILENKVKHYLEEIVIDKFKRKVDIEMMSVLKFYNNIHKFEYWKTKNVTREVVNYTVDYIEKFFVLEKKIQLFKQSNNSRLSSDSKEDSNNVIKQEDIDKYYNIESTELVNFNYYQELLVDNIKKTSIQPEYEDRNELNDFDNKGNSRQSNVINVQSFNFTKSDLVVKYQFEEMIDKLPQFIFNLLSGKHGIHVFLENLDMLKRNEEDYFTTRIFSKPSLVLIDLFLKKAGKDEYKIRDSIFTINKILTIDLLCNMNKTRKEMNDIINNNNKNLLNFEETIDSTANTKESNERITNLDDLLFVSEEYKEIKENDSEYKKDNEDNFDIFANVISEYHKIKDNNENSSNKDDSKPTINKDHSFLTSKQIRSITNVLNLANNKMLEANKSFRDVEITMLYRTANLLTSVIENKLKDSNKHIYSNNNEDGNNKDAGQLIFNSDFKEDVEDLRLVQANCIVEIKDRIKRDKKEKIKSHLFATKLKI